MKFSKVDGTLPAVGGVPLAQASLRELAALEFEHVKKLARIERSQPRMACEQTCAKQHFHQDKRFKGLTTHMFPARFPAKIVLWPPANRKEPNANRSQANPSYPIFSFQSRMAIARSLGAGRWDASINHYLCFRCKEESSII